MNDSFYNEVELKSFGFKFLGKNVKIHRSTIVVGESNISIGDNVRIDGFTSLIAAGGFLEIGSHIHISSHCYIGCSAGVKMDDFSGLAHGVKIYSSSDDYSGSSLTNSTIPSKFKNSIEGLTHLGRHVIIGSNSVVLSNVKIPIGCSVGALSLVNKNLEEWGIYAGSPVRRIGQRKDKLLEMEEIYLKEYDEGEF